MTLETGSRVSPDVLRSIVKAVGIIAVITIAARIAGFLRYLVFGASVGAGDVGTAYASANLVPSVMFEVAAGGALSAMVVPLVAGLALNARDHDGGERSGDHDGSRTVPVHANLVVSVIMTWSLIVTVALAIGLAVYARPIAHLIYTPSVLNAATMIDVGARMLTVFACQLPLYAITIICGAFLHSRKRFLWPALAPLISSIVVMLTYGLYALIAPPTVTIASLPRSAELVLSWGTTAGVLAMAVSVAIPALRAGARFRPAFRLPRRTATHARALALSGLGAVLAQQAVIAIILVLATRAGGTGTLPLFQYAQAVYLLPFAILLVPVMTSVFPHLSELRLVGEQRSFSTIARGSLTTIVTLAALGCSALWGGAIGIEVFFESIDRTSVQGVGAATAALGLGLIGYATVTHTSRILNAQLRASEALVVASTPWVIAGILIVITVLTSGTRRAPDAATLFCLCIAAGMCVGAGIALMFLNERSLFAEDYKAVRRAIVVAVISSLGASVLGLILSRVLAHLMTNGVTALVLGVACAAVSALACLTCIALVDRRQAGVVLERIRNAFATLSARRARAAAIARGAGAS